MSEVGVVQSCFTITVTNTCRFLKLEQLWLFLVCGSCSLCCSCQGQLHMSDSLQPYLSEQTCSQRFYIAFWKTMTLLWKGSPCPWCIHTGRLKTGLCKTLLSVTVESALPCLFDCSVVLPTLKTSQRTGERAERKAEMLSAHDQCVFTLQRPTSA